MMEAINHKPILVALFRALACWIALYLLVAHVYMIVTWPSVSSEAAAAASTSQIIQYKEEEEEKAIVEDDNSEEVYYKELSEKVERLQQELQSVDSKHGEWYESTQQRVSLLEHNANSQLLLNPSPELDWQQVKLPHLQHLLEQTNLEGLTDEDLSTALDNVSQEVDAVMNRFDSVAWDGWLSILKGDYAREVPSPKRCSDGNDDDSSASPDTARHSDLYSRVQKVEAAMAKRKDTPLTEGEVVSSIQSTVQQQSMNDQDDGEYSGNDDEQNDDECVDADQVEWLVDQGLDALLRHKDLRMVLQRALAEIDEEAAKRVILDAVFPSGTKTVGSSGSSDSVNLRHLLDTPLVSQKSPKWVDGVVEHVSGHVDIVDDTLDSLLNDDNDSIGKILVSKVLNAAGRVNVPNPYSHIDSKAGMLKP